MEKATCSFQGCDREVRAKGLCFAHYLQLSRGQDLRPLRPGRQRARCSGPGCNREAIAKSLCGGHYQQSVRGDVLSVLRPSIKSTTRDEQGRKRCSQCMSWKPEAEFYPTSKGYTDGLSSYCARCDRSTRLVRQYGITVDRYDEMLAGQDGCCAICQRPAGAISLHVDHDHMCCPTRKKSCGRCLRGLLCEDCNRAIGMMNDDPKILLRAVEYLSD